MQVVIDTNVLVSGLLNRNSKPGLIIDSILKGNLQLVIDKRVFKEFHDVLHRPKFMIPKDLIESTLNFIAFSSIWVECKTIDFSKHEIIDKGDLPFAELVINQSAMLITGNTKHFLFLKSFGVKVLLPGEVLLMFPDLF